MSKLDTEWTPIGAGMDTNWTFVKRFICRELTVKSAKTQKMHIR